MKIHWLILGIGAVFVTIGLVRLFEYDFKLFGLGELATVGCFFALAALFVQAEIRSKKT